MPRGGPRFAKSPTLYSRLAPKMTLPGANARDRRGVAHLDLRTCLGRQHQALKRELFAKYDNAPDICTRVLVDRACWLFTKLQIMDRRIATGEGWNDGDSERYMAWSNGLQRLLFRLRDGAESDEVAKVKATTDLLRSLR